MRLTQESPGIVWVVSERDEDPHVRWQHYFVNAREQDLLGYQLEEFAGPTLWRSYVHPDDQARVIEENEHIWRTGAPWSSDLRMIAKDGRVIWFHLDRPGGGVRRRGAGLASTEGLIVEHRRAQEPGRGATGHRREAAIARLKAYRRCPGRRNGTPPRAPAASSTSDRRRRRSSAGPRRIWETTPTSTWPGSCIRTTATRVGQSFPARMAEERRMGGDLSHRRARRHDNTVTFYIASYRASFRIIFQLNTACPHCDV